MASLDGSAQVPTALLPASIVGAMKYKGGWNANTNTPAITTGSADAANQGWYYTVSASGATTVDGVSDWVKNDFIVSNGAVWEKIDNTDPIVHVQDTDQYLDFGGVNQVSAAQAKAAGEDATQALADASTADGKAVAAQGDATQALVDASTADGKADAAQGDATQALADAATADGKAVAAQGTADGKADAVHGHSASDVSDFDAEVENNSAVAVNTAARLDSQRIPVISDGGIEDLKLYISSPLSPQADGDVVARAYPTEDPTPMDYSIENEGSIEFNFANHEVDGIAQADILADWQTTADERFSVSADKNAVGIFQFNPATGVAKLRKGVEVGTTSVSAIDAANTATTGGFKTTDILHVGNIICSANSYVLGEFKEAWLKQATANTGNWDFQLVVLADNGAGTNPANWTNINDPAVVLWKSIVKNSGDIYQGSSLNMASKWSSAERTINLSISSGETVWAGLYMSAKYGSATQTNVMYGANTPYADFSSTEIRRWYTGSGSWNDPGGVAMALQIDAGDGDPAYPTADAGTVTFGLVGTATYPMTDDITKLVERPYSEMLADVFTDAPGANECPFCSIYVPPDTLTGRERSSDPDDPAEGQYVIWMSNGTDSGDDGDIMMKITADGVTKVATLIDFSGV